MARSLASSGHLISAIKYLEVANPGISREEAKAIVNSFGYPRAQRWPEDDGLPVRCL